MNVFRVEVAPAPGHSHPADRELLLQMRAAGLAGLEAVRSSRLIFLEGALRREHVERIAADLLSDGVTEVYAILAQGDAIPPPQRGIAIEVHARPGVMDPVAETTLAELGAAGYEIERVRTARRYVLLGAVSEADALAVARRTIANEVIEELVAGARPVEPGPRPTPRPFTVRTVRIRELDDSALERLSRDGHLFLSLDEMRAIRAYFERAGRDPTDLELETLAQTWSEHCVHKTLKSAVVYRGAPMPLDGNGAACGAEVEIRYQNLLKDTIARVTRELMAEGRGPLCLSVFQDNAGVIAFDEQYGIAFKVETHNRPSAIEPYGGAATGAGGCIRDVLGCGLGARPIANTDVFCLAPPDWPQEALPRGVLHPARILEGVVRGVADYGNRMGIPTVNGALYFEPRYLGNPLVFCGCLGLIPRDRIAKAARAGDRIVLVGGRTGRDGIHGATFSSAELTGRHADEFAHAVQIGNAITEKRVHDALLAARDDPSGCLFSAVTDCGAGGLSSAVGEMGREIGATVDLERVPLKYAGLRYDEIWISEAQERMVFAVPQERLERFLAVMRAEGAEATVIGEFGTPAAPRLVVRYRGTVVGDLDMRLLHEGLPARTRVARWTQPPQAREKQAAPRPCGASGRELLDRLMEVLRSPNGASCEWIVRRYDHEVQGGTVIKPFGGPGGGPNDAAVLRPRFDSRRGVAIGCGLAPELSDVDPYWSAASALDEAVRNVVSVGGDPKRTALLDNFCWGRTEDAEQLGGLVRACQACYDAAREYGTPFISGKDSLHNEFALDPADIEPLIAALRRHGRDPARMEAVVGRIRATGRLAIPGTLLVSAVALIDDVGRCVTADLKRGGAGPVLLVGGFSPLGLRFLDAVRVHQTVAEAIRLGMVAACHDVSEGGWLAALAEMALGGACGVELSEPGEAPRDPFEKCVAAYVVQATDAEALLALLKARGVRAAQIGVRTDAPALRIGGSSLSLEALRAAWSG